MFKLNYTVVSTDVKEVGQPLREMPLGHPAFAIGRKPDNDQGPLSAKPPSLPPTGGGETDRQGQIGGDL
nr:hypothetical protein [Anaerolineae bacterium]